NSLDQGFLGRRIEATGVDHRGLPALEADVSVEPVPRHAGRVADERLAPADQAIEEGALADVRTTDDGDDRANHFVLPRRPATRTTTALSKSGVANRPEECARRRRDDLHRHREVARQVGGGHVVAEDAVDVAHRY